jgi:hypothetical protein
VPLSELDEAGRPAGQFLAGYAPFLQSRGPTRATRALRLHPSGSQALVTPVERGRQPRVVSLAAVGQAPGVVLATVPVADGVVTSYGPRITLRHGRNGSL